MKKQSGFTLIELMIVVAIIAILAAIALPAYQNYVREARYSDLQTIASGLKTNVGVCYARNGVVASCDTIAKLGIAAPAATNNYSTPTVAAQGTDAIKITVTGLDPVGQDCIITGTVSGAELAWTYANGVSAATNTTGCEYTPQ